MIDVTVWKVNPLANDYTLHELSIKTDIPSLDSLSRWLPAGSYTTFRTYGGNKVVRLSNHLARLDAAVKILKCNHFELNNDIIRAALRELIARDPSTEHRIRLTLDLEHEAGMVYIALEKLVPLEESAYQHGVKAMTCEIQRSLPKAKLTQFITPASEVRSQLPEDVHEALITARGKILEGLSSNFFAVKNGAVWTAEEGVLSGVTRSVVLEVIRRKGIVVNLIAPAVADIPAIDEAFITSSSRGVLPIVQIDATVIASGAPGAMTKFIHHGYTQRIEDELEEI